MVCGAPPRGDGMNRKSRLAIVSIGIRRDLLAPLGYFSKFELQHFYRARVYNDLTDDDLDETLRAYASPRDLYAQLVRAKPDVIQSVEPFSFYTQSYLWACYFAARTINAALLAVTLENRPLEIKFGRARAFLLRNVLRVYFQRACLILTLNQGARENVLACRANAARIRSALWGVWGADTQEFVARAARDANAPPTILFAGRLHVEKGVFVLLDAFAFVRQKIPTARLLIAGDGPARAQLAENIRTQNLSGSIQMLGVVKNREMVSIFHRADVFCAPSITTRKWAEQVGASALQAMACGLPVVSTRSGSIPEYIPEGVAGILVQEQDASALADALVTLLSNPTRAAEMGQHARAYACAHYDARQNVERGEDLVMEHCVRQDARRV
jgi:glycosyltransferase involved in cell wall biosynthesis